jgi:hypothetical protein
MMQPGADLVWDPLVRDLFVTLQESPTTLEEKLSAIEAAAALCRTCIELAVVLDEDGEMCMLPCGMMRVGKHAETEKPWES